MLIFCTNKVLTAIKRPDTIVVAIPPTNGLVRGLIFFDCYCFGFPVWVRYWFFIPRCTTRLYVTDGGVNIARSFSGYQMYPPIRGFRTNIAHSHLGSYVFYLVLITVHIAKSHFTKKKLPHYKHAVWQLGSRLHWWYRSQRMQRHSWECKMSQLP